jgi:hypothetical protein
MLNRKVSVTTAQPLSISNSSAQVVQSPTMATSERRVVQQIPKPSPNLVIVTPPLLLDLNSLGELLPELTINLSPILDSLPSSHAANTIYVTSRCNIPSQNLIMYN